MIVADDGSRDATAAAAEAAGARSCGCRAAARARRCARRARGAARARCCSRRRPRRRPARRSLDGDADLAIAALRRAAGRRLRHRQAGRARARSARCGGVEAARAALGPARALAGRARAPCFPLAPGFGCETRMTIDAVRAGLEVEEVELALAPPRDRPRPARLRPPRPPAASTPCSPAGRWRQPPRPAPAARRLARALGGAGPARASRSPRSASASPTTSGAAPSAASAPTCAPARTTGVLKLVGIPLVGARDDALAPRRLARRRSPRTR